MKTLQYSLLIVVLLEAAFAHQFAMSQAVDISRLTISGDYTLQYQVWQRDLSPPDIMAMKQAKAYPELLREVYQQMLHKRYVPGTAVPASVASAAKAEAPNAVDLSCGPMTLTVAEHNGTLLYLMERDPSTDPNERIKIYPRIVLYDQKRTLEHDTGYAHLAFIVVQGLNSEAMERLPVFCASTRAITFIKSATFNSAANYYLANALDPGNGVNRIPVYYDPDTEIHVLQSSSGPGISQIIRRNPDGSVRQQMDVTRYAPLDGISIPAEAKMTTWAMWSLGRRLPYLEIHWKLLDAHEGSDIGLFDTTKYLHKGDVINEEGKPDGHRSN